MTQILIIGAGRSATALIDYLLQQAQEQQWFITLADARIEVAEAKIDGHPNGRPTWLDVSKVNDRRELITRADVVISMLPAHLHLQVAQDCLLLKKHLMTASYVSAQLYQLHDEARNAALIFMGELGLDPGIDHMSAMQTIKEIKAKGGKIKTFKSYTGGLVAPESDDNPWHYKFSWNPRNVVLAGQGTAQFLKDGKYKYIPYNRLFSQLEDISIPGMGVYEGYANRDSLLYQSAYGLEDTPTIIRGTLRHQGYCKAWDIFVQLGLTDDSYPITDSEQMTYRELLEAYLPEPSSSRISLRDRLAEFTGLPSNAPEIDKVEWLGWFSHEPIGLEKASPAQIMQHLLEQKWAMEESDKDMIIMQHIFDYELNGEMRQHRSTLILKGEDAEHTAMSKLVGLPLGIFVKMVMLGQVEVHGVNIPVDPRVYNPILKELEDYGVVFKEEDEALTV